MWNVKQSDRPTIRYCVVSRLHSLIPFVPFRCWQPKHTTNQAIAAGEERIEDEGWWWGLAMRKINIGERFSLVECVFFFIQDLTKSKSSSWQASAFIIWSSHFTRPFVVVVIVEPSREMLTWREKVENEGEASMRGEVKRNNIGEKKTSRWSLKMSESCFLMAGHSKPSVLVLFFRVLTSPHQISTGQRRKGEYVQNTHEKKKSYVGTTMMWEWTRSEMLVKHEFSAERMFANKKNYTTEQCNNEPRTLERGKERENDTADHEDTGGGSGQQQANGEGGRERKEAKKTIFAQTELDLFHRFTVYCRCWALPFILRRVWSPL